MAKLFIEPKHGKLGETLNALKEEGFTPQLVGYGYPPMYIEAENNSRFAEAEQIVKSVDEEAKFQSYRADLIETAEIHSILQTYIKDDVDALIFQLKEINHGQLDGGLNQQINQIIQIMERQNKLEALIEAMVKVTPDRF
ncbi:MAG: hypothetical protein AAF629_07440 [Chloroflexota bacterium]